MSTRMRMLAGLMGFMISAAAFADCLEGMRNATPGETQFFKRVYAGLKDALPAPPANWKLAPVSESSVGSFCKDDREGNFEIRLSASYSYQPPKEEGDRLYAEHRKLQSDIDKLKQLPPDIAKERQGWLDKMSEANRASNKAAKEGNKELARQKDAEGEDYSRKGREVRDKYIAGVQAQVNQLEAKQKTLQYGGSAVNVTLVANERNSRSPDPKSASEILVGRAPTPKAPGLKVHNARAVFEGTAADKRQQIQAAFDKGKLERVMQ